LHIRIRKITDLKISEQVTTNITFKPNKSVKKNPEETDYS